MAVTQNTYTGNGSTVLFSFTFPYLDTTDIKVSLNGTVTTAYTLANATTVQMNTAPALGAAIRIYRDTDIDDTSATFFPGSSIRSEDLNRNFDQVLYASQETRTFAESTDASAIQATANTALSNSSAAVTTANAAEATANGIAGTANTALSNSTAAVATANAASTTANGIAGSANAALATANAALPKAGGTMTGAITFAGAQAQATTSAVGIVQLSSSTSSTSETLAATPKAVKDGIAIAISSAVPTGTVMLFQQNSAPTGWTKLTTHDNKALRVVSGTAGTGGSTAFTSVFASRTPGGSVYGNNSGGGIHAHTLSWNQMPSHTHTGRNAFSGSVGGGSPTVGTTAGDTGAAGGSWGHAHGFSPSSWSGYFSGSAMDFNVAYVDVIFASKN
jgi:hypothetical protein